MKTVGINKGLKILIEGVMEEGETVDMCLSRLLDEAETKNTIELDKTRTNIGVSEATFNRLINQRLFSTESHISIIYRLISEKGNTD